MKVLLLSDVSSEHTQKWATGLASEGIHVGIFSLNRARDDWFSCVNNVSVLVQSKEKLEGAALFEKVKYIGTLGKLKKTIREFEPDIVHAHYATSYGMLGALSGFHPFILSVWGADVFDFPVQSILHKKLFMYNLSKADVILSTSLVMKQETLKYTDKNIEVTPFGVDMERFSPGKVTGTFSANDIIVGSVKSLERKYGTGVLVSAFKLAKEKAPDLSLKLLLVGGGSLERELRTQVKELGLEHDVVFTGRVLHQQVPDYHRMIDIFVSVSVDDSESFGVSAVEACASGKAVIVARTGGLKEVIIENETGLIVNPGNINETADAILRFAQDKHLREEFGRKARDHVEQHYDWQDNLKKMIGIYHRVLKTDRVG